LLFVAAFVVRLFYLVLTRSDISFAHPVKDSVYYINMVREIAAGGSGQTGLFFMGPLYPYFLVFIIKTLGFGWMKIRIIQIVIGSLSLVLVYKVARRCFGREKIALLAAISSIFWGVLIYCDTALLMAFAVVFPNLLLLRGRFGSLCALPGQYRFFHPFFVSYGFMGSFARVSPFVAWREPALFLYWGFLFRFCR
jgi:4-amino-4-deoxy-L-arabinose transferase-like glycosyltransferase